jgi:hypothetical protein
MRESQISSQQEETRCFGPSLISTQNEISFLNELSYIDLGKQLLLLTPFDYYTSFKLFVFSTFVQFFVGSFYSFVPVTSKLSMS